LETKKSLVKDSPYTEFFRSVITNYIDGSVVEDTPTDVNNDFYSPSCFKCIKDVMHLFPFWSRAMFDAALRDTGLAKSSPSMTNAKVESYFKSLKSGTLKRQTRLRPMQIVREQLKTVIGKTKEMQLPKSVKEVCKRKRSAKVLHEEEEQWNRRKKPAKYSDRDVSRRLLTPKNSIAKRNNTCLTQNKPGPDITSVKCEGMNFGNHFAPYETLVNLQGCNSASVVSEKHLLIEPVGYEVSYNK